VQIKPKMYKPYTHTYKHTHTWTAPSNTTDQLSLSSMSEFWVYSLMMEEQILKQWSHWQVPRLLNGCASCLQTAHLCRRAATLSSSKWVTASLHRDLHAEQSCESLPRVDGFIPYFFIFSLTVTLYLLTGPHCGWLPTASCPQNTCFEVWLSAMHMMWPTHHSCAFNRYASIPVVPQIYSTSVSVTLYCHLMSAILHREQRWNWSSLWNGLIVGRVSRSHNHTAVWLSLRPDTWQPSFSWIRHAHPTTSSGVYQMHSLPWPDEMQCHCPLR